MIHEPGIYPDIPEREYHADPALSATGIKTLLTCPAAYRHDMDHGRPPKDAYDLGHVVHELILGKGAGIVVVDAADWRTKPARDAKKEAYKEGKAPILAGMFEQAQRIAASVLEHPEIGPIFQAGVAEHSAWAVDPDTGAHIRCRPDWLTETADGRPVCVDIKTTATAAHPDDLSGRYGVIHKFSYHVAAAHYLHTLALAGVPDAQFLLIFAPTSGPLEPRAVLLDQLSLDAGLDRARYAYELYADYSSRGEWPCSHPAFVTASIDLY